MSSLLFAGQPLEFALPNFLNEAFEKSHSPYSDALKIKSTRLKSERTKRPLNAFMLFAKLQRERLFTNGASVFTVSSSLLSGIRLRNQTTCQQQSLSRLVENDVVCCNHSEISRSLGKMWRNMSVDQRQPFIHGAKMLGEFHRREFPDYKYQPRKKPKSKTMFVARNSLELSNRKSQYEQQLQQKKVINVINAPAAVQSLSCCSNTFLLAKCSYSLVTEPTSPVCVKSNGSAQNRVAEAVESCKTISLQHQLNHFDESVLANRSFRAVSDYSRCFAVSDKTNFSTGQKLIKINIGKMDLNSCDDKILNFENHVENSLEKTVESSKHKSDQIDLYPSSLEEQLGTTQAVIDGTLKHEEKRSCLADVWLFSVDKNSGTKLTCDDFYANDKIVGKGTPSSPLSLCSSSSSGYESDSHLSNCLKSVSRSRRRHFSDSTIDGHEESSIDDEAIYSDECERNSDSMEALSGSPFAQCNYIEELPDLFQSDLFLPRIDDDIWLSSDN